METSDYIDVDSRTRELGLDLPGGAVVLPYNLDDAEKSSDLIYPGSSGTVLKLFRAESEVDVVGLTESPLPERRDHDFTLIFPVLFFSAAYLSENPHAISVTLGVISNYATKMLQGVPRGGNVKISLAIESKETKTTKTQKIDYEGPPDKLEDLIKFAESIDGKNRT